MKKYFRLYWKKNRELLFPILSLLLIALSFWYILMPQLRNVATSFSKLREETDRLEAVQEKSETLKSLFSTGVGQYIKDVETALPSEKEIASILISVENVAQETQFTLDTLQFVPGLVSTESANTKLESIPKSPNSNEPQVVETKSSTPALVVNVKGRGNTELFNAFFEKLLHVRRIYDIESVKVEYVPDSEDLVFADLTLFAYYLPPITTIGAIEAKLPEISSNDETLLSTIQSMPDVTQSVTIESSETSVPVGKTNLFNF